MIPEQGCNTIRVDFALNVGGDADNLPFIEQLKKLTFQLRIRPKHGICARKHIYFDVEWLKRVPTRLQELLFGAPYSIWTGHIRQCDHVGKTLTVAESHSH